MTINNNKTDERPISEMAGQVWDLRQHKKNLENMKAEAHKTLMKEQTAASAQGGRESRTGLTESGIIDTGNKKRRSGNW